MEQTGNIYVIEAEDNFKRVHKSIIESETIDCETLGIYTRIIVLGLKWNLNIKGLSKHLRLSDTKVRKAINILEKEGYIVRTAVRINGGKFAGWNYKIFPYPVSEDVRSTAGKPTSQKSDTRSDGQVGSPTTPPADMSESDEDNNNKPNELINLKKKKNQISSFEYVLPEFKETFLEWLEYKKQRRESYKTEKSTKLCYDKLVKLSGNDPYTARQIVEQSMANNWAGLFELKTENRYEQRVNDNRRDSERRKFNSAIAVSTRVQEAAAKRLAELKAEGVID